MEVPLEKEKTTHNSMSKVISHSGPHMETIKQSDLIKGNWGANRARGELSEQMTSERSPERQKVA